MRPRGFATRPHSGQQYGEGLAARLMKCLMIVILGFRVDVRRNVKRSKWAGIDYVTSFGGKVTYSWSTSRWDTHDKGLLEDVLEEFSDGE